MERKRSSNHDDSLPTIVEESGEEIGSSTRDSMEESHSNTSTSTTAFKNEGGMGERSRSKSRKAKGRKKKKQPWTVSNTKGKPVTNSKYAYSCQAKEDHGLPIYGCAFHQDLRKDQPIIFATVGINRATIYEYADDGSITLLQCFEDPDPEENFYTCAWYNDHNKKPLLAAAGARGIITIISPATATCVKHYLGHGQAINELIFHPIDSNMLLSASKDHSLRLWNVRTDYCVVIFGGVEGHRDEVIAADFDSTGFRMVSCGMDHSIKVWNIDKPEIKSTIRYSYSFKPDSIVPFPTKILNSPDFSTRNIHRNYVDCVKWFGNFILSKSCEEQIVCWKAGKTFEKWDKIPKSCSVTSVITKLGINDCTFWFMKFALDSRKHTLALGNNIGKIFVYDLKVDEPSQIQATVLAHSKCTTAVRQTAFSRDGSILIVVCEDATIWRWDIKKGTDEDGDKENLF